MRAQNRNNLQHFETNQFLNSTKKVLNMPPPKAVRTQQQLSSQRHTGHMRKRVHRNHRNQGNQNINLNFSKVVRLMGWALVFLRILGPAVAYPIPRAESLVDLKYLRLGRKKGAWRNKLSATIIPGEFRTLFFFFVKNFPNDYISS